MLRHPLYSLYKGGYLLSKDHLYYYTEYNLLKNMLGKLGHSWTVSMLTSVFAYITVLFYIKDTRLSLLLAWMMYVLVAQVLTEPYVYVVYHIERQYKTLVSTRYHEWAVWMSYGLSSHLILWVSWFLHPAMILYIWHRMKKLKTLV